MAFRNSKELPNTYFIVEQNRTFKHFLEEAFKVQKIKFTSFDVSKNYIVFGANIGSLYVYPTENITKCVKALPSSMVKPIIIVSISPNESNILFADESGSIIILEKCFSEKPYSTHGFNQQKGKIITAVKWENNNKVYIGNSEGTISVLSIKNKLLLSLFHTPYVSLMDLQYRIVQIEMQSPLLLVTTEKKSYVCHIEEETYRQIGTQETSRGFGACFTCNSGDISLYCTRPGLRLWKANLKGEVFFTQMYKGVDSEITEILRFGEEVKDCLEVVQLKAPNEKKGSFGKVQLFSEKFLCIIHPENIYILDPEDGKIIFHYYSNQAMDVRLVKQKIYIKLSSGEILILNFYKFEEFLNEIYFKKQYSAGIRFVLKYRQLAMDWLKRTPNEKLITNLQHQIKHVDNESAHQFAEFLNEFILWEKESMKKFLEVEHPNTNTITKEEPKVEQIEEQLSSQMELMCKKYDLTKTCNIIYMPQFSSMLLALSEDEMFDLFNNFIAYKKSKNVEVEMNWCHKEFLHHFDLKKGHKTFDQLKEETKNFLKESYMNVEDSIDTNSCSNDSCIYPVPSSKWGLPKYDKVGKVLVNYSEDDRLYKKKPYTWYYRLNKITDVKRLKSNLPAILQFGYLSILEKFDKLITYNFCHDLVRLVLELKKGKCLNCGTAFPEECLKNIPEWEKLGFALVPLVGSENVLRIFTEFQQHIPMKEVFSEKFYMGCIFSEIRTKDVGKKDAVEMALSFLSNSNTQVEFRDSLSEFLMAKVDKSYNNRATKTKGDLTCPSCSHCQKDLQHPMFTQIQQLDCHHAFHAICLHFNNNICTICTPNQ